MLNDQPDVIDSWKMLKEWRRQNIPMNTGMENVCVITGFGDSMRGLFESGDPLIIDTGIRSLDYDGIYFFAVKNDEGVEKAYVKRLQEIPGKGIRVISQNKEYPSYMLKANRIRIIGKVLKVWNSKVF